jgi:hypothetical protein
MADDKGGRPTKLTPEVHDQVISLLRAGNYIETAAAVAGLSKQTIFNWLRWGAREETGIYADFAHAAERAMAEAEARDLERIKQATEWQAAAWRLERKFPDRWGRRERHEISGPDGRPITIAPTVDLGRLSDGEVEDLERLLEKARDDEAAES